MHSAVFLISLLCFGGLVSCSSWSYEDIDAWCDSYEICCSTSESQSPIDIELDGAVESADPQDLADKLQGYDAEFAGYITNNGHSATWYLDDDVNAAPTMTTADGTEYEFVQLHFHWGSDDSAGSEHTVDGERFPLEMHMVHYNTGYDSFSDACDQDSGLAVISFLFSVGKERPEGPQGPEPRKAEGKGSGKDEGPGPKREPPKKPEEGPKRSEALQALIQSLPDIEEYDAEADLTLNLASFFDELKDTAQYVTYDGSLTTPSCYETVFWTVILNPIRIDSKQLEPFRQLWEDEDQTANIQDNFRPTQDLFQRVVTRN